MYLGNPLQLGLLLLVIVLLFGKGKVSDLMGDVAKGIKAFKKGLSEDETQTPAQQAPKPLEHEASRTEAGKASRTEAGAHTETGTKA